MAVFFIFAEDFNNERAKCILLAPDGTVIEPQASRGIEEIKSLQKNAKTIVVLPAERAGLFSLALPRLDDKRARAAIPYALEEQLGQAVSELHFSFNKKLYHNNRYLVAVIDKLSLKNLIAKLNQEKINFDVITLDWFALDANSNCVSTSSLLINSDDFNGAITGKVATEYLLSNQKSIVSIFNDSSNEFKPNSLLSVNENFTTWTAQNLLQKPQINLCQGEFKPEKTENSQTTWYKLCAVLVCAWVVLLFGFNLFNLFAINSRISDTDQKISVLYHNFFPEAKNVISPRFRVTQLLNTGESSRDDAIFWQILDKLINSFDTKTVTINSLRYQNKSLSISISAEDFAQIEQLRNKLQSAKLKVTQSQAASQDNNVVATMELSL